ncbi:MAG: aminotransferase class I/II-fold pyridoxal phosphate-dependent enzyme [Planctomycetes bacterium]|nr:aminotransferase class I/II-fold pyridoxal phosphate-dependent enzyme [Planctomycetota bacterium]
MSVEMIEDKLRELAPVAGLLDPQAAERQALTAEVIAYAERFLEALPDLPTYRDMPDPGAGIEEHAPTEEPESIAALLKLIETHVDTAGLNPASGGHMGYIPGGGLYPGALGDYLAAVTNRFSGLFFAGPGAVRLENGLIDWIKELLGCPLDAAGTLTSGGSAANLAGIVAARDALSSKDFDRAVVYVTNQSHESVFRALRVAGMREAPVRHVAVDEYVRMDPASLVRQIEQDRAAGLQPWLLVASAGTTNTGVVDPLEALADVAAEHKLWYHIDAAYGGFFMLCDHGREVLRGIGRGDSIVLDPHKGLFLSYGCGCIIVRDGRKLYDAHHGAAEYLRDFDSTAAQRSPSDYSIELSRHFRGLRLWLPLKLFGLKPFRAALEEKLWLARWFHERIAQVDGFECLGYPELSVATYRFIPRHGSPNDFNRRLIKAIQQDGSVFLSSTTVDGEVYLRMCALCFRTHLDYVRRAFNLVVKKTQELTS